LNGPANAFIKERALLPNAGWAFVAGVYDYPNDVTTIYCGSRSASRAIGTNSKEPDQALWVGAYNDTLTNAATGIAIDEVRINCEALDKEQVVALQRGGIE